MPPSSQQVHFDSSLSKASSAAEEWAVASAVETTLWRFGHTGVHRCQLQVELSFFASVGKLFNTIFDTIRVFQADACRNRGMDHGAMHLPSIFPWGQMGQAFF